MSGNLQDNMNHIKTSENEVFPRCSSPVPPHWSPITPTAEPVDLCIIPDGLQLLSNSDYTQDSRDLREIATAQDHIGRTLHGPSDALSKQPEPINIAEDENPDAIALRAALDILQLQRQKAALDIRKLRDMKDEALADPQAFVRALSSQSLQNGTGGTLMETEASRSDDIQQTLRQVSSGTNTQGNDSQFAEPIPGAQNVVRCPPINWAKYSVDGRQLENVHAVIKKGLQPHAQEGVSRQNSDSSNCFFAGPYRPYID